MRILPETVLLPPRIAARRGAAHDLAAECRAFGPRGLLVHGLSLTRGGTLDRIMAAADRDAVATWQHPGGEPTLDQLETLLDFGRRRGADWVAGVGGGSVMDIAKACAGLLRARKPAAEYHGGAPLPTSEVPFVAAPTTAGTGSEATPVCVLTDAARRLKRSFRHPSLMARLVILDANLLAGCPPPVIAASGMDAFTQAVEAFISNRATLLTDALALRAAGLVAHSLEAVRRDSGSGEAENLLAGACLAGMALSNARLGVVHGLAHPLGARYNAPHGLACAACLPAAIRFNREAMGAKYDRLSAEIGGDLLATAEALIQRLEIRSPFAGRPLTDVPAIVAETLESGSTAANPRTVTADDVAALLRIVFA